MTLEHCAEDEIESKDIDRFVEQGMALIPTLKAPGDFLEIEKEFFMQTINASVFKAKCLKLMEKVNQSGEEIIIIIKNGKPISKLVPYRSLPRSLFGLHKGLVNSRDDLVEPVDVTWDAEK